MMRILAFVLLLSGLHRAPDADVDLGVIVGASAVTRGEQHVRVIRHVEIPLEGPRGGRGTLFAHLDGGADPRFDVRLGGVLLSSDPRIVDARARLGRTATYVLIVEVPDDASQGPLRSEIRWTLEPHPVTR